MKALFMAHAQQKGLDVEYRSFDMKNCGLLVFKVEKGQAELVATQGVQFRDKKQEAIPNESIGETTQAFYRLCHDENMMKLSLEEVVSRLRHMNIENPRKLMHKMITTDIAKYPPALFYINRFSKNSPVFQLYQKLLATPDIDLRKPLFCDLTGTAVWEDGGIVEDTEENCLNEQFDISSLLKEFKGVFPQELENALASDKKLSEDVKVYMRKALAVFEQELLPAGWAGY